MKLYSYLTQERSARSFFSDNFSTSRIFYCLQSVLVQMSPAFFTVRFMRTVCSFWLTGSVGGAPLLATSVMYKHFEILIWEVRTLHSLLKFQKFDFLQFVNFERKKHEIGDLQSLDLIWKFWERLVKI